MTHRGPFQPLPFCDSVILYDLTSKGREENTLKNCITKPEENKKREA